MRHGPSVARPGTGPAERRTYNLRPHRARDYVSTKVFGHDAEHEKDKGNNDEYAHVIHYALTQYSLKKGLEKFKKKGEEG
eukprot:12628768-Ditylum_brightwellii.AAC.1